MNDFLFGRHAVTSALNAGQNLNKIWIAEGAAGNLAQVIAIAKDRGIPVSTVDRRKLDGMVGGENHQGIVASPSEESFVDLEEILDRIRSKGENRFLVLLDGLEDPHNVGAVLRTAEAAGAQGMVITKHRSVGLTGGVAKAAAGALSRIPVARVVNLVQAMEQLQQDGFWIIGADQRGEQRYTQAKLTGPVAIVVGAEGKGLSRLVRDRCDLVVRIPMDGETSSLNASVAAALLMYEVVRQRGQS
jgi:23S rRNA (guanosine2251-2'-O)-methyltransferase